jgi:hypothetical protein
MLDIGSAGITGDDDHQHCGQEKSRNPKVPAVQLAGCPDKTLW